MIKFDTPAFATSTPPECALAHRCDVVAVVTALRTALNVTRRCHSSRREIVRAQNVEDATSLFGDDLDVFDEAPQLTPSSLSSGRSG